MYRVIKKASSGRGTVVQFESGLTLTFGPHNPLATELRPDSELSDTEFALFKSRYDRIEGSSFLARKLAMRPLSVVEASRALAKKGIAKDIAKEIVAEFRERGHLDDTKLAKDIVESAVREKPLGRAVIAIKLRGRGFNAEVVEQVISATFDTVDESEMAVTLLRKRWHGLHRFDLETARHKAYTFLARRGMSYESSRAAFEKLREEAANSSFSNSDIK